MIPANYTRLILESPFMWPLPNELQNAIAQGIHILTTCLVNGETRSETRQTSCMNPCLVKHHPSD